MEASARRPARETAVLAGPSVVVFVSCMLFRSATELGAPRFWADEGAVYYPYVQHTSAWEGL